MNYHVIKFNRIINTLPEQEINSIYGCNPALYSNQPNEDGFMFVEEDLEMTGIEAQNDADFADEQLTEQDYESVISLRKIYNI